METTQFRWTETEGWGGGGSLFSDAQLVFVFGDAAYFQTDACFEALRARFPDAEIVGCSSAGNVLGTQLSDGDVVATAVRFARGSARLVTADAGADIAQVARSLLEQLDADDLRHVFVLLDGQYVDSGALVAGLWSQGTAVSGGIAGDGTRFGKTWVMANAPARPACIVALGLYGDVAVRSVCFGGWREFGPERRVTGSQGNVVTEIDGQPALALYKKYLGDLAKDLPHSGLRFPLSVKLTPDSEPLIRSVMGMDEDAQSLRFAGDVPQGCLCRLMRTQLDDLIDTAELAAEAASAGLTQPKGLCLVVSCTGRRSVLGQMTEVELEVVQDRLGPQMVLAGFYSYGELAPHGNLMQCQLHNQTMTLTTLHE